MSFVTLDKARSRKSAGAGTPVRAGRPTRTPPTVNLLPPATLEALAVRRIRERFVAAGLVGALLVGGGWLLQTQRLHGAQDRLAAEQAVTPTLTGQVQALEPVARFFAQVEARKSTASAAMAAEVLFSEPLADLVERTPDGVDITAMSVTLTPSVVTTVAPPTSPLAEVDAARSAADAASEAGAARAAEPTAAADAAAAAAVTCARPDPFNPAPIIGCVTISGTATDRDAVGRLIDNLRDRSELYADPFITTTTASGADGAGGGGGGAVQFSGSVGLTGAAVSGRYADLSWLADPSVLAQAERRLAAGARAAANAAAPTGKGR